MTHPDILEAACVAVPDSHWGERPKAFVTVKSSASQSLTGEQIIAWSKENPGISGFMVPREIEILEAVSYTHLTLPTIYSV